VHHPSAGQSPSGGRHRLARADIAFRAELEWFATRRGVQVIYLLGPAPDTHAQTTLDESGGIPGGMGISANTDLTARHV
jgi:hypothetical protein